MKNFLLQQEAKDFLFRVNGLPLVLQPFIQNGDDKNHDIEKRSGEARTFSSGCFDAFTVFAFMAFLLALLDLILELQMQRKKRSVKEDVSLLDDHERNATLASHSIFRGFLNTLDGPSEICAQLFFCQGTQQASKYGDVGREISKIATLKAAEYLQDIDAAFFHDIAKSGLVGILQDAPSCQEAFPCIFNKTQDSYRHPGSLGSSSSDFIRNDPFYRTQIERIINLS